MKYWSRYVERMLYGGRMRRVWKPLKGWLESKKWPLHYNEHRPWTTDFRRQNEFAWTKLRKRFVESINVQNIKEWNIFTGDRVMIMVGKDKGKIGRVNSIIKERNWVFVDNLNIKYDVIKDQFGCRVSTDERPLLYPDQVKLIDPFNNQNTEVKWVYDKDGNKVRVSKNSGVEIPLPIESTMTEDLVIPKTYKENTIKDTNNFNLTQVTYKPGLKNFEQDLMEFYKMEDDQIKQKTYWY